MTEPKQTQAGPYVVELGPGEYWWCSCGLSDNQPFCDGTHDTAGTGLKPLRIEIAKRREVALCGCRQSKNKPFCDGTHETLETPS